MAERVQLDASVAPALDNLRKKITGDGFVVFGYEGKNVLKVVAEGPGFVDAAKEHLIPSECRYVLLRKEHRVELASTVKFILIDYTPEGLPPTRRALLSTHKGQLRDLLGQTHVVHQAGDLKDITESDILDKIGMSAGTKINVTDKAAWTHESKASAALAAVGGGTGAKGVDLVPKSAVHSTGTVRLADEAAARAAIADVRKDSTETNWALFNYANDSTIQLVGTGSGGIEELASRLDDTQVFYAFFRTTAQQDKTTKVIFCSLKLLSMNVSTVARAKLTTHKGFVDALFSPVHTEFNLDSPADFTVAVIAERVAAITLTASHLVGHTEPAGGAPMLHRPKESEHKTPASLVPTASSGVVWEDEAVYREAMAGIKAGTITWFVARWAAKDTLGMVSSGVGDVDAAVAVLEPDNVNFIYQRLIDRVDKTDAIKFVAIKVQPETVSAMKKGQVNTKKGAIDSFFQPAHVSYQAASPAEVTPDIVRAKVQAAAGTKPPVTA